MFGTCTRSGRAIGAVAVKSTVYALPANTETQEDFEWLLKEIVEGGGEAMVCEARLVDGLSDAQVCALFDVARDGPVKSCRAGRGPQGADLGDATCMSIASPAVG